MKATHLVVWCAVLLGQYGTAAEDSSPRKLNWQKTPVSLALLNDTQVVWRHIHDRSVGKPFMRFGLIDGTELTRPWPFTKDYPKNDHVWHRSLWWSWKAIDGVNYWEQHQTGTDPVKVELHTSDDGAARISMRITYHEPEKPPVVNEHRVVRVSAPDAAGSYLITWYAIFSPAGTKDVIFNQNSYGGLALRFAGEYCGDVTPAITAWRFINSEGVPGINGRTARWVAFAGKAQNGRPAAVAVFDHPSNPRHPTFWQTRTQYPYLNPSLMCKEEYRLAAGSSLALCYGIFVHSGTLDAAGAEKAWKDFAATEPSW